MKLVVLIAFLFLSRAGGAQSSKISVGIDAFITIPNLGHLPYVSDLRGGASLKVHKEVGNGSVTITGSYLQVETPNHVFINLSQVHAGYRFSLSGNFYTEPQVGYTVMYQNQKNYSANNGISAAVCFGYTLKGVDFGIDYRRLFSQTEPLPFLQ